jgi:hypothetical protein
MVAGWVGEFVRFSKTPVRFRFVVEPLLLEFDVLPPEKPGVDGLQLVPEVLQVLLAV